MYRTYLARLSSAVVIACASACGSGASTAAAATTVTLHGAGSTLIAPLESEWASAFEASNSAVKVVYDAVGSGQGLKEIAAGLVDFGASDAPLSASPVNCAGCYEMPWALSATGVGFHVNNLTKLHLTGGVIAQIYLGKITNWDDHRIQSLNKGVRMPNLPITVFFRGDGSGDTYAFTDYESRVSPSFRKQIGSATSVNWLTGFGRHGNSGMVQSLAATNGSIAYVAVSYLIADWPRAAAIKNAAGKYEVPNYNNIANAAQAFRHIPANNELDITNPPASARTAYPISTYTYVIAPGSAPQGALLRKFIGFAIKGGQQLGPRLDFVPIPGFVRRADQATLRNIH